MTARFLSRAGFLAALTGAVVLAATPAFAARNTQAEQYLEASASGALRALADRSMSFSQRQETFHRLMAQFADMPRIAFYVLGRYSVQLRSDPQLRDEWNRTFEDYSIAVYQDQLDTYSSSVIHVTGSVERIPGQDVVVTSEMVPRGGHRPTQVQWRILKSGDVWRAVDVSLVVDGNEMWLAQQQQRDFLAALDANHGDIRALIRQVQDLTARMRARIMARN